MKKLILLSTLLLLSACASKSHVSAYDHCDKGVTTYTGLDKDNIHYLYNTVYNCYSTTKNK